MGALRDAANTALRDFNLDGVPSSDPYKPIKAPIRAAFGVAEDMIAGMAAGVRYKGAAKYSAINNASLASMTAGGSLDGGTLAAGDRILLSAQTNASQCGVYVVQASGPAVRASDMDEASEFVGALIIVTHGTSRSGTLWGVQNTTPPVVGTDPIIIANIGMAIDYTGINASIATKQTATASTAALAALTLQANRALMTNSGGALTQIEYGAYAAKILQADLAPNTFAYVTAGNAVAAAAITGVGRDIVGAASRGDQKSLLGVSAIELKTDLLINETEEAPLHSVGNGSVMAFGVDSAGRLNGSRYIRSLIDKIISSGPGTPVYMLGDSRNALNTQPGRTRAQGWWYFLDILTGGRLDFDIANNFAVGGWNSEEVVTQLDQLRGKPAGVCFLFFSTNDLTEGWSAPARSIPAMQVVQDVALSWGHTVIWIGETPRGDGNSTATDYTLAATPRGSQQTIRRWQMAQAQKPNVYVADPFPEMVNPASTASRALDTMLRDGIHWGAYAAYVVARQVARIVNTLYPPRSYINTSNADIFSAANLRGALTSNQSLTGGGGTASGGNVTGTVANDMTISAGTGITAVCSKPMKDGFNWQQVVFTGAPTATNPGTTPIDPAVFSIVASLPISHGDVSTGDMLDAECVFELDSGHTGIRSIGLYLGATVSGSTLINTAGEPDTTRSAQQHNMNMHPDGLAGVLRVPKTDPLAASPSAASLRLMITGAPYSASASPQAVPMSGTIRFRAIAARKVA